MMKASPFPALCSLFRRMAELFRFMKIHRFFIDKWNNMWENQIKI